MKMKSLLLSPWTALITLIIIVSVVFTGPTFVESVKLRYFDSAGAEHETFAFFQIKLILLSETTNKVPRIADMRAIALSL